MYIHTHQYTTGPSDIPSDLFSLLVNSINILIFLIHPIASKVMLKCKYDYDTPCLKFLSGSESV